MIRKTLIIANDFPPIGGAGVQRPFYFAKYLPRFGWLPTVVTIKEVIFPVHDYSLLGQLPPDVDIRRTESFELRRLLWWGRRLRRRSVSDPPGAANQSVQQTPFNPRLADRGRNLRKWLFVPDDRMLWAPFAVFESLQVIKKSGIDAIFVSVPPYAAGVIGYLASKLGRIPLVLDLRDPWARDPYFQGPTRFHRWLNERLELMTLRHARKITVISEAMQQDLLRRYPEVVVGKITVITNGYAAEEFDVVQHMDIGQSFVVAYVGSLYVHHLEALRAFCRAWTALCDEDAEFAESASFWVVGRCDDEVAHELSNWPKMKARLLGYQSHADAMRYLVSASALLLLIRNLDPHTDVVTIPGKLFEYIAAGSPILMIGPEGDAAEIIRSNGGSVHQENDVAAITSALREIYHASQSGEAVAKTHEGQRIYEREYLTSCLAAELDAAAT